MRAIALSALAVLLSTAFAPPTFAQPAMQLANRASTHCATGGGKTRAETNPRGGAYGVCVFEDNRQCEEWALLRGHCPVGGLRVTGYVTPAAR